MTNITEADHDAVDWLYEMGVIAPHHLRLANKAFARHRKQTERQSADHIEALEAENMMLREERDRLIKFVNIMCEEYGLEYDGVVKQ